MKIIHIVMISIRLYFNVSFSLSWVVCVKVSLFVWVFTFHWVLVEFSPQRIPGLDTHFKITLPLTLIPYRIYRVNNKKFFHFINYEKPLSPLKKLYWSIEHATRISKEFDSKTIIYTTYTMQSLHPNSIDNYGNKLIRLTFFGHKTLF